MKSIEQVVETHQTCDGVFELNGDFQPVWLVGDHYAGLDGRDLVSEGYWCVY